MQWGQLTAQPFTPSVHAEQAEPEALPPGTAEQLWGSHPRPQGGAATPFELRPASQPLPRPGQTQQLTWEAPAAPSPLLPEALDATPARVVLMTPQGAQEQINEIRLQFDRPATPLGQQSLPELLFEPPLEGIWSWSSPDLLRFQLQGKLPAGRIYRLRFQEEEWSFYQPAPRLAYFNVSDQSLTPDLSVGCSQPLDQQRSRLEVFLDDRPQTFEWITPNQARIDLASPLQPDTVYQLRARLTAYTPDGDQPQESTLEKTFRTYPPLKFTLHHSAQRLVRDKPSLSYWLLITASNALPAELPLDFVKIEPEPYEVRLEPFRPQQLRIGQAYSQVQVHLQLARGDYQVSIGPGATDIYGQIPQESQELTFQACGEPGQLFGPHQMMVVPPQSGGHMTLFSLNLPKLNAHWCVVTPDLLADGWPRVKNLRMQGHLELDSLSSLDCFVERSLELSQVAPEGHGLLAMQIGSDERTSDPFSQRRGRNSWEGLVQWTSLGLSCLQDGRQALLYCFNLADGQPRAQVQIQGQSSDPHGLLLGTAARLHWAQSQPDACFLFTRPQPVPPRPGEVWVVCDRGLYRPGETVQWTAWLREWKDGRLLTREAAEYTYRVVDSQNQPLTGGTASCGSSGLSEGSFQLPAEARLGTWNFWIENQHFSFRVEEFRRPEFSLQLDWSAPNQLDLHAEYYSGGDLAEARWECRLQALPYPFVPPGRQQFTFGNWRPRWTSCYFPPAPPQHELHLSGVCDQKGRARLHFEPGPVQGDSLWVTTTVTARDSNQQATSASSRHWVHPSSYHVGLRSRSRVVGSDGRAEIEILVTDRSGQAVEGVAVRAGFGSHQLELVSASTPVTLPLNLEDSFSLVWAECEDAQGGLARTQLPIWKGGLSSGHLTSLEVIPEADQGQPGQTLEFTILSPTLPAYGFLAVCQYGIRRYQPIALSEGNTSLQLELREEDAPGIELYFEVWSASGRQARQLRLEVSRPEARLRLQIQPRHPQPLPNQETAVEVQVLDHQGQPAAQAHVTLWVVDEAVLDLAGHRLANPWNHFARTQPGGVTSTSLDWSSEEWNLDSVWASYRDQEESMVCFSPGGSPAGSAGVTLRSRFDALAAYQTLECDHEGRAVLPFTLPGSLTRYRITAIATRGGEAFGLAEQNLRVSLPLSLKPTPPRFWQHLDKAEVPVLVQNLSEQEIDTEVASLASSHLTPLGAQAYRLRLRPGQRRLVTFAYQAMQVGQAELGFACPGDAILLKTPIYTPATREHQAAYGELEEGAVSLAMQPPARVWPDWGGLEVEFSVTLLDTLKDATVYLNDYPFECTEQLSARLIGLLAMRPLLAAWKIGDPDAIESTCARLVKKIRARQQGNGTFSVWGTGSYHAFTSLQALLALGLAQQDGLEVGNALELARGWAQSQNAGTAPEPHLAVLSALASYVCGHVYREFTGVGYLPQTAPLEAVALALPALAQSDAIRAKEFAQVLSQRLVVSGATARAEAEPFPQAPEVFYSRGRLQAWSLLGWVQSGGDGAMAARLTRGLLGGRIQGRWRNTQENVYALLAIRRYFERFEKAVPDLEAAGWYGETPLLQARLQGREAGRVSLKAPMDWLLEQGGSNVCIAKQGPGRLYYRIGLDYAPQDWNLDERDRGFGIKRSYSGRGVRADGPGRWRIELGSTVKVLVTITVPCSRFHVAVVSPQAAGLEPLALAVAPNRFQPPWWQHQQQRDERSEAFCLELQPGTHAWEYSLRATCAGHFHVPPAWAEEMYHPECSGRTGSEEFFIE